jgi:hypothetical protein
MSLIKLPNEIILLLMKFLDPCDQIRLISTCKHLRKFISDTDIWLYIDINNYADILFKLNRNHTIYDIKNIVIHNDFDLHLENKNHYNELILNQGSNNKTNKLKTIDLTRFNKIKNIKYISTTNFAFSDLYKIVLINGSHNYNKNQINQLYTHIKFIFINNNSMKIPTYNPLRWVTGMHSPIWS